MCLLNADKENGPMASLDALFTMQTFLIRETRIILENARMASLDALFTMQTSLITETRRILEIYGNFLNDSHFMTNGFFDNRKQYPTKRKTFLLLILEQCCHHIKNSQLNSRSGQVTCMGNQLTGFQIEEFLVNTQIGR